MLRAPGPAILPWQTRLQIARQVAEKLPKSNLKHDDGSHELIATLAEGLTEADRQEHPVTWANSDRGIGDLAHRF